MKATLYKLSLIVAAALAFASCEKAAEVEFDYESEYEYEEEPVVTHVAKVTLSKDAITKTAVVEGESNASYVWTDGDDAYLHIYENGTEGQISSIEYSTDYSTATVTVSFTGSPTAPYTYTAKYAKTMSNAGNPLVQATQNPSASNYDPGADIMISRATANVTNLSERVDELSFTMGRVVTVNKMTLTGLEAGEYVSKVEFTLDKNVVAYYAGEGTYNGVSKKLTLNYTTPLAVGSDGKFPVYFVSAPVDAAGIVSVVVTTDKNVYTKSGNTASTDPFYNKSITFSIGTMKRFNMGMSGYGEAISSGNSYTLVQSQSELVSGGTYIIVGNNTSLVAMAGQNSNNRAKVDVTATDNVITVDNTTGAYTFTIESVTGGYTIKDNSNSYYLYDASSSSKNYLRSRADIGSDNLAVWTISVSGGVASIENVGYSTKPVMCYNTSNSIFACYASITSNYRSLSLYKQGTSSSSVEALATPTNLTATNSNGTVTVTWGAVTGADSYTVTCTGQTILTGLTTCSAEFSGLSEGTYTITVTAISDDHTEYLDSDVASTEINVLAAGAGDGTESNPYSASEAITLINSLASNTKPSSEVYVTGIISTLSSYSSNYNSITYYISDDGTTTNQLQIYSGKGIDGANFSALTDLNVGEKVVVKGYLYNYNGTTPEIYRTSSIVSITHIATSTVTTGSSSGVSGTGVTLSGSFSGASGRIYETGFYYGTSSSSLTSSVTTSGSNDSSGNFNCEVTGLTEGVTYYYKAYVLEYNAVTKQYEEIYGSVSSFKTSSSTSMAPGYLSCYEVPDVTGILSGSGTKGTNSGRDDIWYRYYTNSSSRQIAVHTFTHPTSNNKVRNYTVLYDGNNYAPLWTAHAMHSSMWLDDGTGRSGSWTTDPAISLTQQTGLDNASSVGYSRGHFVSSQERQSTTGQNAQTFYYTNQAPQWQNSFNGGIWSTMETAIVDNAPSGRDTLYVVTGVLYEGTVSTLPSGSYDVPIPSHFYKCLMKCSFDTSGNMTAASAIAYLMTNEAHSGHYYDSEFVTTIDAVEARAGFDFFPNVPSSLQSTAEATATPLW